MLDYVYKKTYGVKYISFSYFLSIFLYSKIRWLFILFGKNLLMRFSKFNKYLEVNKNLDIVNISKKIKYNNYLGEECFDSFMDLYNKSIDVAICRINDLK